jgi:acetylglutamate kinase
MNERLELLRESLPYIQKFKGKTFVIKFSGKVTENKDNLASLAEEVALMHQVGIRICIVHGGGKQLSELAEKLGVVQTVVEGRRVTDDHTLELAKMVFAGKINTEILAAFRRRGIHSVGLSGIDGNIINARKRPPKEFLDRVTGSLQTVDFGNVGDILEVNTELLKLLLDAQYLPVVSSLGADSDGEIFNINADTIAAEIAIRLDAEKLILLSDVDGIFADPNDVSTMFSRLSSKDAGELIESGKVTGGMVAKIQSLSAIAERGVGSVHLINGGVRNTLLAEVFTDEGTGTMLTA